MQGGLLQSRNYDGTVEISPVEAVDESPNVELVFTV